MTEPFCGEILTIDQGADHWVLGCVEDIDHEGPHASMIVWPKETK